MVPLAATMAMMVVPYAGTGTLGYSGDDGPALKAELNNPFDVAFDREGHLYFSDTNNHVVRRVDAETGVITTVAGSGKKGDSGDGGPATEARLNEPYGVLLDDDGNLFLVDRLNFRVRKVDAETGTITTVAGTGESGFSGDGGPADKAMLREPNGIALDGKGKLYIADVRDQRIRVVELKSGTIETFCGDGKKENLGDGGPYEKASLLGPRAVTFGPDGSLFVCEREGHCVRKIDLEAGTIVRYAGTGKKGFSGDGGPALQATFNGPKELGVDPEGNLYVVDTENHVIRRIDAKTGEITSLAPPPGERKFGRPHGVAVGPDGQVYVGDTLNHQIRAIKIESK